MNEYLLPAQERDWPTLLENWSELLPEDFSILMANAFGDLFIETSDGAVALLDINAGSLATLAESRDAFLSKLGDERNAAAWLYLPLVATLRERGSVLHPGECYAFSRPPVLGGEYHPENVRIADFAGHLAFCGDIAEQLRDVEDGDEVELKVRAEDYVGCEKPDCCSKGPNPTPGSCKTDARRAS